MMEKSLEKTGKRPVSFWIAMAAHALILLAWIMQAYSLIDWEGALALGLQENSFLGSNVDIALAGISRGLGIADMIWGVPLSIIGIAGLIKRNFAGYITTVMLFSICIYFPLFFVFQKWATHMDTAILAIALWLIPSAIALFGLIKRRDYFLKLKKA